MPVLRELDPFLWQNLLLLAGERSQLGRPIVSSELPARCGIPPDQAVRYLDELGRRLGWVDVPHDEIIIAVHREKDKVR